MLDLQKYFKAINAIGVSQLNMQGNFGVSLGAISNWIQGKKEPRISEEAIFIGTENCRKMPIFKAVKGRKKEPITYSEDRFLTELIDNLAISAREKSSLIAEYGNSGYEHTLRYIIHLAKIKEEFVPTLLLYEKENPVRPVVGAGQDHVLAAFNNGRVHSAGLYDDQQCNTHSWRNIISVVGCWKGSIGLRADGTCVATGLNVIEDGSLFRWMDIGALAAGTFHVLGQKTDGTVSAFGRNPFGQCNVSEWKNIIGIAAGANHSVGLRADGTVVAAGKNDRGQCDVKDWINVKQVAASGDHTLALLADGTVVGCGNLISIRPEVLNGVKAIATGEYHAVGLREDGCVLNTGADVAGLSDVERWHDMIAVSAAFSTTIGVRSDGRVFVTHDKHKSFFLDTDSWKLFENGDAASSISQFDNALAEFKQKLSAVKKQALKVSPYISQFHENVNLLDFSLFPAEYKTLKTSAAGIFQMYGAHPSMPTLNNIVEMFLSAFCEVDNTIAENDGQICITEQTYEPFMDLLFTINQLEPEVRLIEEGMSFSELTEKQLSDFSPLMGKIPTLR